MIALTDTAGLEAVFVGGLLFMGTLVTAVFAYLGAQRTKTPNGQSLGEMGEEHKASLHRLEIKVDHHIRSAEAHTQAADAEVRR